MNSLVEIQYDSSRLQKAMNLYYGFSSKSEAEVIQKQAKELDTDMRGKLRELAPARGSIRGEQVAAMKAIKGRGVKVRESVFQAIAEKYGLVPFHESYLMRKPAVSSLEARRLKKLGFNVPFSQEHTSSVLIRGKHLNFQALAVMRELNLRESGIGFMSISTPQTSDSDGTVETDSRYGQKLSEFILQTTPNVEEKYALLRWVGGKGTALEGLSFPRQQTAMQSAINDRINDMVKHVSDKIGTDISKAGLS